MITPVECKCQLISWPSWCIIQRALAWDRQLLTQIITMRCFYRGRTEHIKPDETITGPGVLIGTKIQEWLFYPTSSGEFLCRVSCADEVFLRLCVITRRRYRPWVRKEQVRADSGEVKVGPISVTNEDIIICRIRTTYRHPGAIKYIWQARMEATDKTL
jgi:hypothetical protein